MIRDQYLYDAREWHHCQYCESIKTISKVSTNHERRECSLAAESPVIQAMLLPEYVVHELRAAITI
jgi:hypothetical protein